MDSKTKINLIINKIILYNNYVINYFEENVIKLSHAGKYQIFLLTSSIVIQRLKEINAFQNSNIDRNLLTEKILLTSHEIFDKLKKEHFNFDDSYNYPDFNFKPGLDSQNRVVFKKNKSTLDRDSLIIISVFMREIEERMGFKETHLNICVYPFFSVEPKDEKDSIANFFTFRKNETDIFFFDRFKKDMINIINNISNKLNDDSFFMSSIRPSNKNCYVATLVYGDIDHEKVEYLRLYRDRTLYKTKFGKVFVKHYYRYAPRLVQFLRPYDKCNLLIKNILNVFIYFVKKIHNKHTK